MEIYGLHCSNCGGDLEVLNLVNGTIQTKCKQCNLVSRPNPKIFTKTNQVYSKFAKKSVEVEYSRPRSNHPNATSKSGTYTKTDNTASETELKKYKG